MDQDLIKKKVGEKGASLVEEGMIVGLGSGSTSHCFIYSLIERVKKGLRIEAVSSSKESALIAQKGGIPLLDINETPRIDVTFDGADEIDEKRRMIKGGGGAHVREKILAAASKEMIVLVDETKWVKKLGTRPLPIEILFFGFPVTKGKIEKKGYRTALRKKGNDLFITDNGNLILDLFFDQPLDHPEKLHEELLLVPGVVDTGFFFNLAKRVLTGYQDGQVVILNEVNNFTF